MPYDEGLAERLADLMPDDPGLMHTGMFGGFGYLLNGNMCIGIWNDWLILRVGIDVSEALLKKPYIKPFDLTGKAMKGWVMVSAEASTEDEQIQHYIKLCIDFTSTLPAK
jgi:TfoX/Sxy family transcriptional regulator of competence genes